MSMQVFQVPNQRGILGVSVQRTRTQVPPQQTYRELEAQMRGTLAFASGISNPQSVRGESVNIVRPGMKDEVHGMRILGGMSCKYNGGRQRLSLLLVTPSRPGFRPAKPTDFYAMKVPSHGRWNNVQEFTLSKTELDLVSDALPVFCDPSYEGERGQGLADIQRKYGVPRQGIQPVSSTDSVGLRQMVTDATGNVHAVPDRTPDRRPGVYSERELYLDGYYDEYERLSQQAGHHDEWQDDEYADEYGYEDTEGRSRDEYGYEDARDRNRDEGIEDDRPTFRRPGAGESFDYMQSFGIGGDDEEEEFHIDSDVSRRWESPQQDGSSSKPRLLRILVVLVLLVVVGLIGFLAFRSVFA